MARNYRGVAVDPHRREMELVVRAANFQTRTFQRENVAVEAGAARRGHSADVLMNPWVWQAGCDGKRKRGGTFSGGVGGRDSILIDLSGPHLSVREGGRRHVARKRLRSAFDGVA